MEVELTERQVLELTIEHYNVRLQYVAVSIAQLNLEWDYCKDEQNSAIQQIVRLDA